MLGKSPAVGGNPFRSLVCEPTERRKQSETEVLRPFATCVKGLEDTRDNGFPPIDGDAPSLTLAGEGISCYVLLVCSIHFA